MEQPKNTFKIVPDKKARMILPNALTLIGVCIGLSSIKFALDSKFELSIIAIIFAALFDGLDGRIARLIKGTSKVGKELDSLTDVISFGVAPAFIMYFWSSNYLSWKKQQNINTIFIKFEDLVFNQENTFMYILNKLKNL